MFLHSTKNQTVYICVSPNAPAYHFIRNCRGLNRCTHRIIQVSEIKAINKYNRRKCGYE